MYLINIAIRVDQVPAEKFHDLVAAHRDWFLGEVEKKNFLLVGPYLDWQGAGIILARTMKREELNEILSRDAFWDGLADYEVHEFKAIKILPALLSQVEK